MNGKQLCQLIIQARQGDDKAFVELCERGAGVTWNIAKKYSFSEWETDDIFQEARIVLYQTINKIDLSCYQNKQNFPKLFFGYYQRSLNNHFLNQIRHEKAQKRQSMSDTVEYDDQYLGKEYLLREDTESYAVTHLDLARLFKKSFNSEERLMVKSRLEGLTMRECSKKLHHGTKYTNELIKNIRQTIKDEEIID